MNVEPVSIFMPSFYFTDVIFMVIDRIEKVTKYPYKIIVGDNLSDNSPEIREKLRSYVEQGKISTAYFFDNNSRHNRPLMFNNEQNLKYCILSDQDALIDDNQDGCWLTDFIEMLELDNNVGIVGFSAKNGWGPRPRSVNTTQRISDDSWTTFIPKSRKGRGLPFNGHFMTYKTEFMDKYCKSRKLFSDGNIQRFIASLGYASARYDKTSVYNLSSIKRGYEVSGIDVPVDQGYTKLRGRMSKLRQPPGNFEMIRSSDQ